MLALAALHNWYMTGVDILLSSGLSTEKHWMEQLERLSV